MLWWALGVASELAPGITARLMPLALSPHLVPMLEAVLAPPGYCPNVYGMVESEARDMTRAMLQNVEPHFAELYKDGTQLFRGVETYGDEAMELMFSGKFKPHPDAGQCKNFFPTKEQMEFFVKHNKGLGTPMSMYRGTLPYSALGGARFLPYRALEGTLKIHMPNSQLGQITPIKLP
ncbi:hypothetical protein IV102_30850 [bacterium]|nr:hypothetical protein [bacterium]